MRFIFIIISVCIVFFGVFLYESSATITYTPASAISMTGSSDRVFFDVADDIYTDGSIVPWPHLDTSTSSFSWAYYLSGAGWVDFSTGIYRVDLVCGQPLASLTADCSITGTGYSEMIGDVVFSGAMFHHYSGELTGTMSTYIWDYALSGVRLPLLPIVFRGGNTTQANHTSMLTLSWLSLHSGLWAWSIHMKPIGWLDQSYTTAPYDLSHASIYRVEITDPDGGMTLIDDFEVVAGIPSPTLDPAIASTVRYDFCTSYAWLCVDGATLTPMTLEKTPSAATVVANGVDTYSFVLKLRDRYGNAITKGQVRVDYRDAVREIQTPNAPYAIYPYMSYWSGYAIQATGLSGWPGTDTPTTGNTLANLWDISYSIASIAPTSTIDTLTLSWVIYTDTLWVQTDIAPIAWKAPLDFAPWYTTTLSAIAPIVVWSPVEFTTGYAHTTSAPTPTQPRAIYSLLIGGGSYASLQSFMSPSTISCAKYSGSFGMGECSWMSLPDTAIISTDALSFSGVYSGLYDPPPETVSYESYIRYMIWGVTVLYPSSAGSLGTSVAWAVKMKVLGQQDISARTGISPWDKASIWNTLRKNVALLSRSRTNYSDIDYIVYTGDISLDAPSFTTPTPEKRTIVTVGWDITITGNIAKRDRPLSIIALADRDGQGWDIIIDPSVTDIHASLFAEKSVKSTGSRQLYIYGSVISYNTVSDTICPYYISVCPNPKIYNLENLRSDFLTTPGTLSSGLAGKYSTIPLVIEYDGRVLTDPPPILEK